MLWTTVYLLSTLIRTILTLLSPPIKTKCVPIKSTCVVWSRPHELRQNFWHRSARKPSRMLCHLPGDGKYYLSLLKVESLNMILWRSLTCSLEWWKILKLPNWFSTLMENVLAWTDLRLNTKPNDVSNIIICTKGRQGLVTKLIKNKTKCFALSG